MPVARTRVRGSVNLSCRRSLHPWNPTTQLEVYLQLTHASFAYLCASGR